MLIGIQAWWTANSTHQKLGLMHSRLTQIFIPINPLIAQGDMLSKQIDMILTSILLLMKSTLLSQLKLWFRNLQFVITKTFSSTFFSLCLRQFARPSPLRLSMPNLDGLLVISTTRTQRPFLLSMLPINMSLLLPIPSTQIRLLLMMDLRVLIS